MEAMKVAIVGLGPAGCRAAMLLNQPGIDLHLFEARERIGGRLHTVSLEEGGFYEAGAEWIDADQERILGLLEQFGQKPSISRQFPGRVVYRGEVCQEDDPWEDCLASVEGVENAADLLLLDIEEPAYANVLYQDLDDQNLGDFLNRHATTPRGRWWLESTSRSDEGDDTENISLLGWLAGCLKYQEREPGDMSAYRFPFGATRFCEQMLEDLPQAPRFGVPLRRVERSFDQISLVFDDFVEDFDRVVLCLPAGPLAQVAFDPPLSESKQVAIEEVLSCRAIKISLFFDKPWWKEDGKWSGRALTDFCVQQVWDATRGDGPYVMNCYICGDGAEEILASSDPIQKAFRAVSELGTIPEGCFLGGAVHDWIHDPYSLGGFSNLPPGFVLGGMEYLGQAEGRIHFAGEQTSTWIGFIEGALESAERVAAEVLACKS